MSCNFITHFQNCHSNILTLNYIVIMNYNELNAQNDKFCKL